MNNKKQKSLSPIQKLKNDFYIKREDLIPFSFGGNKARKAQLFFNEIDCLKVSCVLTYGTSSSNHCRVVANMAAQRGLPCYIIGPKEKSDETFNSKLIELANAKIEYYPVTEIHDAIEKKLNSLRQQGEKPYFIMGGGHGHLGTQAYIDCYNEIKRFEHDQDIFFDYIFHASGTGTTQAGLICGKIMCEDYKREIIGISIARDEQYGKRIIKDSIKGYLNSTGYQLKNNELDSLINFCDKYRMEGYGQGSVEINETIKEAYLNYGIPLDVTYTGKAFYGMQDYLREKDIKGKKILFIHTGGTPLFFDSIEKMM